MRSSSRFSSTHRAHIACEAASLACLSKICASFMQRAAKVNLASMKSCSDIFEAVVKNSIEIGLGPLRRISLTPLSNAVTATCTPYATVALPMLLAQRDGIGSSAAEHELSSGAVKEGNAEPRRSKRLPSPRDRKVG